MLDKTEQDEKLPQISFTPTPEIMAWLNEERREDNSGKPESYGDVVKRKLSKLMKLEQEGY